MGGSLSTQVPTRLPSDLSESRQHTACFMDLPREIVLEVTSYLSRDEIKTLRGVCKDLDDTLLATFGDRFFSRLHLLPTSASLDILTQISTQPRLNAHVRELRICSSIYQFWGARETQVRPRDIWTRPQLRVLSETARPFPDPSSPTQEAANLCAELVRGERFREQLTGALRNLRVARIEVQEWPRDPSLVLGRKDLMRFTDKDPFEDNFMGIRPAWEYQKIDMVTRMTEVVFSAVRDSGTPLAAMIVDRIQVDQLKLALNLGYDLLHLKHLEIGLKISDQSLQLSDTSRRFDLFTLIDELPCLEHLSLSNFPGTAKDRIQLTDALIHINPQRVKKLCLGVFWGSSPQVLHFLGRSVPDLQDLSLRYAVRLEDNKAWEAMFSELRGILCLQRLRIDIDGFTFEACDKDDNIDSTLAWLAENTPDNLIRYKDPEDSEDEDLGVDGAPGWRAFRRGPSPRRRSRLTRT
ncbi:hypothetical protein M436DRAFT_78075 [Aureobasidium namibiae CBS 147.97]|uniref:F-box domain-containing protein n=1 Tax=Aureobasidium namibiae CBS 147.97 TaxID=1043004 RepID=A0A074WYF9_9PEZI